MQLPDALILEVFKQEDSLRIGLFQQSQSAPTLRHYSQVGVSFEELKQLSLEMVAVLNRSAKDHSAKLQQLKSLQKTGQLFWDHLFNRSIKARLKESPPCGLILFLDEELIQLPWELIFDGADFLALKFSLGRLVRSKGEEASLQYRDLTDSLKMLILANPSGDLKSAYLEGLNIKNQFIHKTKKVHVDFKSTQINKQYVKKNIADYDIVHFAGHCEFDKLEPKASGWVLSDGVFKAEDILKMGQSYSLPVLVFSNGCYSAKLDPALIDAQYQQTNYGMACAFLFAGVRHYIGAIRKIEDNASLVFARAFYTQLISGSSVGEALRLARLKLIKEYGLASLHWVNYLLYGDPGFFFFKTARCKNVISQARLIPKRLIFKIGQGAGILLLAALLAFWLPRINPAKQYLFLRAAAQYRQGNNQAALKIAEQLISRDKDYLAVYPIIADIYQQLGDKQQALKYYVEYMLRSEKLHNQIQLIQAYIKLGWFYQLDGQYDKAKDLYDKAMNLSRQLNDRQGQALALRKLAVWNIDKGDYDQALDLLTKSVAINLDYPGKFENMKNLASDYFDIGLVFANKNDYEAAKSFYVKSLKLFERLKLTNELSDCYFNIGEIYFFQKQYQSALSYYFKGLKLDEKNNNQVNLACGLNMIGELYLEIDDLKKAEDYFKQSIVLASQINSRLDLASANYNLGLLYKRRGRKNLAKEHWRKAQEIYRSTDPAAHQEIRNELWELENL
jgi:tetratricopeptide (TPR) repeat protein